MFDIWNYTPLEFTKPRIRGRSVKGTQVKGVQVRGKPVKGLPVRGKNVMGRPLITGDLLYPGPDVHYNLDTDNDGVQDSEDCQPFDPTRQDLGQTLRSIQTNQMAVLPTSRPTPKYTSPFVLDPNPTLPKTIPRAISEPTGPSTLPVPVRNQVQPGLPTGPSILPVPGHSPPEHNPFMRFGQHPEPPGFHPKPPAKFYEDKINRISSVQKRFSNLMDHE